MLLPIPKTCPACSGASGTRLLSLLLGHADDRYGGRIVQLAVAEVDIHEFDTGHDLQLLLDASAPLDGVIEDHLRVVVRHPLVREQKLHKAAERLAHSYLIARVEIAVEPIEIVQMMGVVALAHALAELAQAIGDGSRNAS